MAIIKEVHLGHTELKIKAGEHARALSVLAFAMFCQSLSQNYLYLYRWLVEKLLLKPISLLASCWQVTDLPKGDTFLQDAHLMPQGASDGVATTSWAQLHATQCYESCVSCHLAFVLLTKAGAARNHRCPRE